MSEVPQKISIFDVPALDRLFKSQKIDPYYLRRFRNHFFKQSYTFENGVKDVGSDVLDLVLPRLTTGGITLKQRLDSQVDGATKLLFETADGFLIETVILRIDSGRISLCVSSQVGCKFDCTFCATGKLGFRRHLSYHEILAQVIAAQRIVREEQDAVIRNIVFMGMGEPLDNFDQLLKSLEVLTNKLCFNFSPGKILVSTCGLSEKMVQLVTLFPGVNLALSLHGADDLQREKIMPVNKRDGLISLGKALDKVCSISNRDVMVEYLLFDGVNDQSKDAEKLIDFLKNRPVIVNLIKFNQVESAPELKGSSSEQILQFKQWLEASGLKVTRRYSLGLDIEAACGQLVYAADAASKS